MLSRPNPVERGGESQPAAVEFRQVDKWFDTVAANAGVNFRVEAGTIHGIVGENGAGKSTAMKLLYGLLQPDQGEILVYGRQRKWRSPADAIKAGIGMVHQHFMLAGPLSALDNILPGAEPGRWGWIDRHQARSRLETLARENGMTVDWDKPIEQLSVGIQQRVEVLKLLFREAEILIFDEPTAVLTPRETTELFATLRRLRSQGKTILLVTHKLKEVTEAADRVTVFRAGKVTGEMATRTTNPQELANLMVGRNVGLRLEVPLAQPRAQQAIEVKGLTVASEAGARPSLSEVSFCVRRGEVVGIAGVAGNGQLELVQALLRPQTMRPGLSGRVWLLGQEVTRWTSSRIRQLPIAVIPEDRLVSGLLVERPVEENFLLGRHREASFSHMGFLCRGALRKRVTQAMEAYDVRPRDPKLPASKLSGGNQQKLLLAREFLREPAVVLAVQPTRGVDVGAIEFIHRRVVAARDAGAGVLLVSSELEEILTLSDRILVMYEGRIVDEFERNTVSEQRLGLRMGGA